MLSKYLPILSFFTLGLLIQPIAVHSQTLNYNYSTTSLSEQSLLISQLRPGDSCEANDNLSLLADTFIASGGKLHPKSGWRGTAAPPLWA
jgi:hypothetical protein